MWESLLENKVEHHQKLEKKKIDGEGGKKMGLDRWSHQKRDYKLQDSRGIQNSIN